MQIARTIAELRAAIAALRADSAPSGGSAKALGLVPTMGALHEGHLSLVRASQQRCAATVVSIFVNPAQFSPAEDLSRYPRPIETDLDKLRSLDVDLVFLPDASVIYPPGFSTTVDPPAVARRLEGASRPEHFRGVCTVVLKLLLQTGADIAWFGQKDWQQSVVIRHMVRDLNVPIDIVVCPIVRDDDGVALSSRNAYLDAQEQIAARSLSQTLKHAASMIDGGETDARLVMAEMTQSLIDGGASEVDYAVVADPESLEVVWQIRRPVILLVAARVGETRLIDNWLID